jgi:hypothetical protein
MRAHAHTNGTEVSQPPSQRSAAWSLSGYRPVSSRTVMSLHYRRCAHSRLICVVRVAIS